jgi:2-iminobutanoate/2-iminopropanoate deaminase
LGLKIQGIKQKLKPEAIRTDQAPQPIGPYEQGVRLDNFLFLSGQIALDPNTGEMVGTDVETQTRQVIKNLEAVLKSAGSSLDHVLKTSIFLTDLSRFPEVNRIYGESFGGSKPARSTVEVSALPKNALVEIDLIAFIP